MLVLYSLLFLQLLSEGSQISKALFLEFVSFSFDYLNWLLPIGCFLATLFTFSFLSKNRELLALDATGFSTFNILRPVIIVAFFWSLFSFFFQNSEKIQTLINEILKEEEGFEQTKFHSFRMSIREKNRTWFFQSYDLKTSTAEKIHLYCYDKNGKDILRINAQSGFRTDEGWVLENGRLLGFHSDKGVPQISDNHEVVWNLDHPSLFKRTSSNVLTPQYKKTFNKLFLTEIIDDPEPFALLKMKPHDMTLASLFQLIKSFPNPESPKLFPYKLRKAQLIWNIPACLLASICALAITLKRQQNSIGVLIGVSFFWIISFYVLRSISDALGEKGILSSWIATSIPFVIIFTLSIFMISRRR